MSAGKTLNLCGELWVRTTIQQKREYLFRGVGLSVALSVLADLEQDHTP